MAERKAVEWVVQAPNGSFVKLAARGVGNVELAHGATVNASNLTKVEDLAEQFPKILLPTRFENITPVEEKIPKTEKKTRGPKVTAKKRGNEETKIGEIAKVSPAIVEDNNIMDDRGKVWSEASDNETDSE